MLSKLRAFASLYRELGPCWTLFRLAYAFRLRTGLIRIQMPMGEWDDYKGHITNKPAGRELRWLSGEADRNQQVPWKPQIAIDDANRLLNGELKYFSHQFIQTGFPPKWNKDYVTDIELDSTKHWSQISDDHLVARSPKGDESISYKHTDIKFVWEPNRFTFVYTLVCAYAASQDEKYAEAFWTLIEDWAQHNPPNMSPNWMDGQEIAIRLTAWTFGYHTFLNSQSTTHERKEKFILYIAAQAERIYKNIGYAISTRSNHTISEAFGLWMVGLLFTELKHATKYLSLGKQLLEQEAANQIFPDGSYSMYSINYHRFILHIYLYAIRLGEINNSSFSTQLINSVTKSIEYLACLINPETGDMPLYGSNDGALFLPLTSCDFTDYRPLLQLGWFITKGEFLFEPGPWDDDIYWICGESLTARHATFAPHTSAGETTREENKNLSELRALIGASFPNGGMYLLRSSNSQAFIRCTDFTSRPSHADQLHLDLWIHGHNLAIDAGTFLYSGEGHWRNGLAHTSGHNTVTVDNKDQMTMLSRFTWTNWSNGKVLKHNKNIWQGEHDGYNPVSHQRKVIALREDHWLVIDKLSANESHHYALHWLLNDYPFEYNGDSILLSLEEMKYKLQIGMLNGNGELSIVRADPVSTRGWRSLYYGHKEPAISVMLEANLSNVTFWSFFGFENDVVEIDGNVLSVNSKTIEL